MDAGTTQLIVMGLATLGLVLTVVFMLTWQNNRLEERMRASNTALREANSELRAEMRASNTALREANRKLRAEMRHLSNRVSELSDHFGERISEVESNQARLEGANSVMQAQAHTHTPPTPLDDA